MEGVTLLESGTSRVHFAFVKRLEAAKTATQADEILLSTIGEVLSALASKSAQSWSSSSLTSHLILLLHCIDLFPSSNNIRLRRPPIQASLVPALHLAAIAKRPKELLVAYTVLGRIFAEQSEEEQRQTSLLLLNTTRQHLEATSSALQERKGKRGQDSEHSRGEVDSIATVKSALALKSIIAGVPAGPDIFPALYGPISRLCHHPEGSIHRLALDALGKIYSYLEHDDSLAKGIWERVRGMMTIYESNHTGKSTNVGDSLGRALLRATRRALDQKVINDQVACQSVIALIDVDHSPSLSIACFNFCVDVAAASNVIEKSILETIWRNASELCVIHSKDFSTFVSGAAILGRLASLDANWSSSQDIKAVWQLLKNHFFSKNANCKLLLLNCLDSLLPFSWFNAGNAAGIELEEAEMADLLAMLGDKDESIRLRSLQLFNRIDSSLLDSHLNQLLTAASDTEERKSLKSKELIHRAVEVASIGHGSNEAEQYSNIIHRVLQMATNTSIDDGLIRLVVRHLRAADAHYSSQYLFSILQKQQDTDEQPSPTFTLLVASLACEVDCETVHCKQIVTRMAAMAVHLNEQAALLEALLIGMTKLVLCCPNLSSDITPSLSKARESTSSSVIKHRLNQLIEILQDESRVNASMSRFPSGSLLDTMDRLDAYFAQKAALPSTSIPIASTVTKSKPLKYDAYEESTTMSPSSSTSISKSFSALPPPSIAENSRTRRQRKQKEDELRLEMQKSIARLTLDTEYDSQDEGKQLTSGSENGTLL